MAKNREIHVDASLLHTIHLFAGVDSKAIDSLARLMSPAHLRRGEILFLQGDAHDRFFCLLTGKVKIERTTPDGRKHLLLLVGPGEICGEIATLTPETFVASATAAGNCDVLSCSRTDLLAWISQHPEGAMNLLETLAGRLRRIYESSTDFMFSDVPGRVARAILDLANRFGEESEAGIFVGHDLTQEEIAQLIGASRETVNKALADFVERGWIRQGSRCVTILNRERMEQRAH